MINKKFSLRHFSQISLYGFLFTILVLLGCNDDFSKLGKEILPPEDTVSVGDAIIYVDAYTVGPVPIPQTDSFSLPLGIYNDPVFGKTDAGFMVGFSINNYTEISADAGVLSVELNLVYSDYIGDSLYVPQIEVYSLLESIDRSINYTSDFDETGKYEMQNLAISRTVRPDSTLYLKLSLNNNIGEKLISISELNDTNLFINHTIDSVFDSKFTGLYIKSINENSLNGILDVYNIYITVLFQDGSDTSEVNFVYNPNNLYYPVSGKAVLGDKYIKMFDHDYTSASIPFLNDTINQDTAVYIQSLGGTQAHLKFRGLESLRSQLGNVIINRAELVIPFLEDSAELADNRFPEWLGLRPVSGYSFVPEDIGYTTDGRNYHNYMNGEFNYAARNYSFYLTRYFQDYFNRKVDNTEFRLFSGYLGQTSAAHTNFNSVYYNRIIISSGAANFNKRIALKLVYTKL